MCLQTPPDIPSVCSFSRAEANAQICRGVRGPDDAPTPHRRRKSGTPVHCRAAGRCVMSLATTTDGGASGVYLMTVSQA